MHKGRLDPRTSCFEGGRLTQWATASCRCDNSYTINYQITLLSKHACLLVCLSVLLNMCRVFNYALHSSQYDWLQTRLFYCWFATTRIYHSILRLKWFLQKNSPFYLPWILHPITNYNGSFGVQKSTDEVIGLVTQCSTMEFIVLFTDMSMSKPNSTRAVHSAITIYMLYYRLLLCYFMLHYTTLCKVFR